MDKNIPDKLCSCDDPNCPTNRIDNARVMTHNLPDDELMVMYAALAVELESRAIDPTELFFNVNRFYDGIAAYTWARKDADEAGSALGNVFDA